MTKFEEECNFQLGYITDRFIAMTPDALSTTFAALADPTRRAILARLATGETSVKELSEPFEMSQPAISKHLKVLEKAGLIARGRDAQWRPARLKAAPLKNAADWLDDYRLFWEQSFDRLDEYLKRLQAQTPKDIKETKERPYARNRK